VSTNPSRLKRLGAWIVIVPALSLFSFSIVASAAGFQGKPDVAKAAAQVVPSSSKHDDKDDKDKKQKHDDDEDDGGLVVVDSSHGDDGIASLLGHGEKEVCWISRSGLTRVSAVYRTSVSSLRVGQKTYSLVTVFGANTHTLRTLLGTSAVQCKLVHVEHVFFLPFDPNIS